MLIEDNKKIEWKKLWNFHKVKGEKFLKTLVLTIWVCLLSIVELLAVKIDVCMDIFVGSNLLATIYYYSETKPIGTGNYWHYENSMPTLW